jgi:CHAT domain-containing protein/Tfp pilus assembly protein PilF
MILGFEMNSAADRRSGKWQRALLIMMIVLSSTVSQGCSFIEFVRLNKQVEHLDAEGRYDDAIPLAERVVEITEQSFGPENRVTAGVLNNLGNLYLRTGAYTKAEPLLQRALAMHEKVLGPDHPETATSLNSLGILYRDTGAYTKAESFWQRALAIWEKALGAEHPLTAMSLNNLGILYRDTGAYTKAESFWQRALAIREKALGPDHPDTAESLSSLGGHYSDTGAYAKAEPLLQRALAIHEKVLRAEHPLTAMSLNNLGILYRDTAAYTKAEPLLQRALAINEKALGPEHPDTAGSLDNLALLRWATGNQASALALSERAQAIREKNTAVILLFGSAVRKQAYLQQFRRDAFTTISLSMAIPDRRATSLGITNVLQIKGRILDVMSDSVGRLRQSVNPEDRALLDRLATVAQQLSALTYQGIGNLSPEVYRQRLRELDAQQEQLETELSTRGAIFRQQVAPITLPAVQTAIPKDTALVEWFRYQPFDPKAKDQKAQWGHPRYVAYVLKHENEPAVVDVGHADTIEGLIHDFRTGLGDPRSTYVNEVAKELYDKLVNPLYSHLDNANHLLISPDGALNLLPFAALVDETGSYLGKRFEITYLTSGRDLLRFGSDASEYSSAMVVADPDYGPPAMKTAQANPAVPPGRSSDLDRGDMTFTPLPGTAAEAQALAPLLKVKKDHLLTQAKATEAKVKQLHGPRILHIATHGFFLNDRELPAPALRLGGFARDEPAVPLGENPLLRSGLALAGANLRQSGDQDDGILTAAEVAQMDLRGTQLVVLSACETGVGDVQNGEGVYGLRRALVLAGAETQVASLWKVADDATKDLMVEYYERLLNGEGRSAALRAAQRTMMTSPMRAHPYYWAAFVPIGQWTPLAQGR